MAPGEPVNQQERTLVHDLFDRLLAGELAVALHFQPIVDLYRGVVAGYEALTRFPAVFGAGPDVCLGAARDEGRVEEVEDLICRQTLEARPEVPANCFLALNLGPEYLVSDSCCRTLERQGDLSGLIFEITEQASIRDYTLARHRLARIRELGGSIAVDDAGSGYASLSHILEMRPEFIKLDRRLVQNCNLDRAKSTMIEMLGAAANRLDAWILAEGVETAGELEELLLLGVPLAQGYFFGSPTPGMAVCNPFVSQIITKRQNRTTELLQLQDFCGAALRSHSLEEAFRLLGTVDEPVVVVLDHWDRPTRVVQRHPLLGIRQLPGFMKAQVASEPTAVLQRALQREAAVRFDPIIVIGPEGEFLGVLELDRLMSSTLGPSFPRNRLRM